MLQSQRTRLDFISKEQIYWTYIAPRNRERLAGLEKLFGTLRSDMHEAAAEPFRAVSLAVSASPAGAVFDFAQDARIPVEA